MSDSKEEEKMIAEEFREVLALRKKLHPEDDFETEEMWKKETEILSRDMQKTIDFLENECTAEELYWISEVFDEVVEKTQSKEFIECLYRVVEKYPAESEEHRILVFIHYAEGYLEE
jgi:hypothetical protein